jgi:hypothetical protein
LRATQNIGPQWLVEFDGAPLFAVEFQEEELWRFLIFLRFVGRRLFCRLLSTDAGRRHSGNDHEELKTSHRFTSIEEPGSSGSIRSTIHRRIDDVLRPAAGEHVDNLTRHPGPQLDQRLLRQFRRLSLRRLLTNW